MGHWRLLPDSRRPAAARAILRAGRRRARRGADAVVLGHAFWTRRFAANPAIIGQTIRLNDVNCTIVGVARPACSFHGASSISGATGPSVRRNAAARSIFSASRGCGRKRRCVSARANLDAVASSLKQQHGPGNWSFQAVPLTDAVVGDARTPLYLLFGAVGILLLIALANVANLLLARAASRQREVAVRVALGAGRARITRQLLTESALLSIAGGMLGVLLGVVLTRAAAAARRADHSARSRKSRVDTRVMMFALALSLAAGLLFGTAPALQASGTDLIEPLRDDQRAGAGRSRRPLQRGLVVAEIALALMLSIGAGLLIRSLVRLQHVDAGFEPGNVLTFALSLPRPATRRERLADLLPAAARASAGGTRRAARRHGGQPAAGPGDGDRQLHRRRTALRASASGAGRDDDGRERVVLQRAGIPLDSRTTLRCAAIATAPRLSSSSIARSRIGTIRTATHWPALPHRRPERPSNPWMRIVGIVGDVKYSGLAEPVDPAFYLPFQQQSWSSQFVVVRTAVDPPAPDRDGARCGVVDRSRAAGRPGQDDGSTDGRSRGRLAIPRLPARRLRSPGPDPGRDRRLWGDVLRGRAARARARRPGRAWRSSVGPGEAGREGRGAAVRMRRGARPVRCLDADRSDSEAPVSGDPRDPSPSWPRRCSFRAPR